VPSPRDAGINVGGRNLQSAHRDGDQILGYLLGKVCEGNVKL
jgi:hypothetical protein